MVNFWSIILVLFIPKRIFWPKIRALFLVYWCKTMKMCMTHIKQLQHLDKDYHLYVWMNYQNFDFFLTFFLMSLWEHVHIFWKIMFYLYSFLYCNCVWYNYNYHIIDPCIYLCFHKFLQLKKNLIFTTYIKGEIVNGVKTINDVK